MEQNTKEPALRNLTDAHTAYVDAANKLGSRVRTAKLRGASWAEIAAILGVTRQAAQQRYGYLTKPYPDALAPADQITPVPGQTALFLEPKPKES